MAILQSRRVRGALTLLLLTTVPIDGFAVQRRQQQSSSNLAAPYGILGAGSAVVDDRWLIIGGVERTIAGGIGLNETSHNDTVKQIASSIRSLNLNNGDLSSVNLESKDDDDETNRMGVRSQTCDYDSTGTKRVYCFGGLTATSQTDYVSNVGVFDQDDLEWKDEIETDDLQPRSGHSSVLLSSVLYIFGGMAPQSGNAQTRPLSTLHSLDLNIKKVTELNGSTKPSARAYHCAAPLNASSFVVIGGADGSTVLGDAWVYDIKDNRWTNVTGRIQGGAEMVRRGGHACVWTPRGVIVSGGYGSDFTLLDDLWLLNTSTLAASQLQGDRPPARAFHQIAAIGPYVAIFGGETTFNSSIDDWVAADPRIHFYDLRPQTAGLVAAVPFGATLRGVVVPGQNSTNNDDDDDDDGDDDSPSIGTIFAGILGILGALFLCLAWIIAIIKYRKRHHHHHRFTGAVHQHHYRHPDISAPIEGHQIRSGGPNPQMQPRTVATGPGAALAAGVLGAFVPPAAAAHRPDATPRPTIPTRTPTVPGTSHDSYPTVTSKDKPSGSLNVVPSAGQDIEHEQLAGSTDGVGTMYRVLWAHHPQQSDELAVQPGDVVEERRSFADQWMLVKDQSGRCGMIPRNILKGL